MNPIGQLTGRGDDPITAAALYPRWADFLRANDILMAETGTASMGLGFAQMPAGACFHNQTLWGSIGWATPAAFGAAVAAPGRRVVLITGEDRTSLRRRRWANSAAWPAARDLCAQQCRLSDRTAAMQGSRPSPITICAVALRGAAAGAGLRWLVHGARATCGELDQALAAPRMRATASYIEVVTDAYAASPLALKLHESLRSLYKS